MIDIHYTITADVGDAIESLITDFERDRERGDVDLANYTPPRDDKAYAAVVTELSRIDLEYRFNEQRDLSVHDYLSRFPDVFDAKHFRTQLAFEEFRLRRRRGEDVQSTEIASKYDVQGDRWPQIKLGDDDDSQPASVSRRFSKAELSKPQVHYPAVGETFAGYPLLSRIGEGAFSRVFLARQGDLAGRVVVLKLTSLATDESDCLASLQHTSIIPVYSVHRDQELTGICMPFLGATTLADLVANSRRWASLDGPAAELVSTLRERHYSTIQSLVRQDDVPSDGQADADTSDTPDVMIPTPSATELEQYASLGYVDAIVAMVIGATEGLAHAHRRGIVHRDLKPANILLADDGTPVLLDFNLAASDQLPTTRVVGGTLPYMSPQQLQSLESGVAADQRDDVFSMGVILYEMLSGQQPFESPKSGEAFELQTVIKNRCRTPASVRSTNSGVSRGLESIINKCLAPDRDDRYGDAVELLEDLTRHQKSLPLKYAKETSRRERFSKWCVRHPRLSSGSTVAMLAAGILLISGLMIWRRGQRIAALDAQFRYQETINDLPELILELSSPRREVEFLEKGLKESTGVMSAWHIGSENWEQLSGANRLKAEDRQRLSERLGGLAHLMVEAEQSLAVRTDDGQLAGHRQQESQWQRIALLLAPDQISPTESGKASLAQRGEQVDRRLSSQPTNVALWFNRATLDVMRGDFRSAHSEFDVAHRLSPGLVTTRFNLGLCHLEMGDYQAAFDDFDQCVRIAPDMMVLRFNRAVASHRLGNNHQALEDLGTLIDGGKATTRMLFFRAEIYEVIGQRELAAADRIAAMQVKPVDADDWVARGNHRLAESPEAALDDYLVAIQIQPFNFHAINNAAYVYAERINQPDKAIEMLTRLCELRPNSAAAVASRGILHARHGEFDSGIADAISAAQLSPGPREQLQIAGIYAMASSEVKSADAEKRQRNAFTWLAKALRNDVSIAQIAMQDHDLDQIRNDQQFARLIASAGMIDQNSRAKLLIAP
ncbi:MAG: protein kinase [Planctomycetales bacterium]|nr:protein kinase [Planctomycetales bacterium]